MRRSQSLLGLIGLILLFFGIASFFLTGALEAYTLIHLLGGAFLVAFYLAAGFRDLRALLSARSTRYGANMVLYSVLFILLLAGINWLGVRYNKRIDMSEAGAFTLSPQSKSVLGELGQDLELQAFLEGGHNAEVESLLESFAADSPRVKVQLIDPDEQPELTQKYGVRAYGTVRVQYGEQATTVSAPSEESLTNAIIKVTRMKAQVAYFVEGQGEPSIDDIQTPDGFGAAKQALENENYRVEKLVLVEKGSVPDDANILALAAPQRPLLEPEVQAISAYLSKGGRAIFFLPSRSGDQLAPVLDNYGVKLGNDVVVDQVVRLFQGPQLGLNPIVTAYGAHPITRDLKERTIFPLTRSVSPGETRPGLTVTSIAKTSESSWAENDIDTLFEKSEASLEEGKDQAGPVSIAVAANANLKELGSGEGETRLVVYGTAAFADNQHINMLFNQDLFLNSFAWLASQEELVSIRPRTVRASRVRFSREEATSIFYLSVLVLPEILLILGLAVWWRRSRL